MGIHYDYKSTRGEKAMRKEAKRKARLEQKKARRNLKSKNEEPEDKRLFTKTKLFLKQKLRYFIEWLNK